MLSAGQADIAHGGMLRNEAVNEHQDGEWCISIYHSPQSGEPRCRRAWLARGLPGHWRTTYRTGIVYIVWYCIYCIVWVFFNLLSHQISSLLLDLNERTEGHGAEKVSHGCEIECLDFFNARIRCFGIANRSQLGMNLAPRTVMKGLWDIVGHLDYRSVWLRFSIFWEEGCTRQYCCGRILAPRCPKIFWSDCVDWCRLAVPGDMGRSIELRQGQTIESGNEWLEHDRRGPGHGSESCPQLKL